MASIDISGLSYRYQGTQAGVRDINLAIPEGTIACLVGASGCGKSTLLRLLAGFIKPDSGTIAIGGETVAGSAWVPAEKRHIGLVFQQHALFPHLDAGANILFGATSDSAFPKLLADFHLEGKDKRFPHELSGGEQQRVALARALAAKPKALLMDEPFASIDSVLRRKIRSECIDVLRKQGVTTLMVTHDAEEAMELADHIFVMSGGAIVQSGSAQAIYANPANAEVAGLFGDINHLTDPKTIRALTGKDAPELLLRPEQLEITDEKSPVFGTISQNYFRGSYNLLHIAITPALTLKVSTSQPQAKLGGSVYIRTLK